MINEAYFSVSGYVATDPKLGHTRDGIRMLSMRVGWTPRRLDRATGEWVDQPSSFISVQCFRKVAEHAGLSLRRGDPIVLKGTLRVREYEDQSGAKRNSVDVVADTIGHDMLRGISSFSRPRSSQEPTAMEREQATAAAARDPLPGDRPPVPMSARSGADGPLSGPDSAFAAGASAGADDPDFEADAVETFDLEDQPAGALTEAAETEAAETEAAETEAAETEAAESAEPVPALV